MLLYKSERLVKKVDKKLSMEGTLIQSTYWLLGLPIFTTNRTSKWVKMETPQIQPMAHFVATQNPDPDMTDFEKWRAASGKKSA